MEIYDYFIRNHRNKFIVTEDEAYFVPCAIGNTVPPFADILAEVFDLGDPEVVKTLDEKFDSGTLILGYLEADGGLDIHVPPNGTSTCRRGWRRSSRPGSGWRAKGRSSRGSCLRPTSSR